MQYGRLFLHCGQSSLICGSIKEQTGQGVVVSSTSLRSGFLFHKIKTLKYINALVYVLQYVPDNAF